MQQAYLIEADHFGFRTFVESDLDDLLLLDADPTTMKFFPGGASSSEEIQNNIKKYMTAYHENCPVNR